MARNLVFLSLYSLTIGLCFSVRISSYDVRGSLEGTIKRESSSIAQPRVTLAYCVLSKLPNCIITRHSHG